MTVETCAGLGACRGVEVDEIRYLEEEGRLTCCVYAKVAVYEFIARCVAVEGEDGVEDEKAEEAEYEKEEDAHVEDAAPRETVVTDTACLGVMETVLIVDGIEEVVGGVVLVGDEAAADGGEGRFAVVLVDGTKAGEGGGGRVTAAVGGKFGGNEVGVPGGEGRRFAFFCGEPVEDHGAPVGQRRWAQWGMTVCRVGGVTGMDGIEVEVAAPRDRAGAARDKGIYGVWWRGSGGVERGRGKGSCGPPVGGWTGPDGAIGRGGQKAGPLDKRAELGRRTGRFRVVLDRHRRRRRLRSRRKTKL